MNSSRRLDVLFERARKHTPRYSPEDLRTLFESGELPPSATTTGWPAAASNGFVSGGILLLGMVALIVTSALVSVERGDGDDPAVGSDPIAGSNSPEDTHYRIIYQMSPPGAPCRREREHESYIHPVVAPGIGVVELTDGELAEIGVEYFADGSHLQFRWIVDESGIDVMIPTLSAVGGGMEYRPSRQPVTPQRFAPRVVTDDMGRRRLICLEPGAGSASEFEGGVYSPDRLIPVLVRTGGDYTTRDSLAGLWRPNYILWYEATPEFLSALPVRVREAIDPQPGAVIASRGEVAAGASDDGTVGRLDGVTMGRGGDGTIGRPDEVTRSGGAGSGERPVLRKGGRHVIVENVEGRNVAAPGRVISGAGRGVENATARDESSKARGANADAASGNVGTLRSTRLRAQRATGRSAEAGVEASSGVSTGRTGGAVTGAELLSLRSGDYTGAIRSVELRPNPASDRTRITLVLDEPRVVTISLHDLYGRQLDNRVELRALAAGQNELELPVNDITPGIYLLVVTTEHGGQRSVRLMVERDG